MTTRTGLLVASIAAAACAAVLLPASAGAAYSGAVNGNDATLTGDGAPDALVLELVGGQLRHNRTEDAGFESGFDFDSTVEGSQTIIAATPAIVTVKAGGGNDIVVVNAAGGFQFLLAGQSGADSLSGGPNDDQIDGGSGPDELLGGDGNDILRSRDGQGDTLIDCGAGADDLDIRDQGGVDPVPLGCERDDSAALVLLSAIKARVTGGGSGRLSLDTRSDATCPAFSELSCALVVKATARVQPEAFPQGSPERKSGNSRRLTLASEVLVLKPATAKRIKVKLTEKFSGIFRRSRSLKVNFELKLSVPGTPATRMSKAATLRAPG
jgi:hypothetical protein